MRTIRVISISVFFLWALGLMAQSAPAKDPFQTLSFLEGTWEAKTNGTSGVDSLGKYSFELELRNHVLSRNSVSKESCKGPENFDCNHSDLLYVFPGGNDQALQAIYFDNEGHVIKYQVSTPSPTTAVFLSDGSQPGPQFQLVYERKGDTMSGKFQMRMPGQSEWKSYLEWSGKKD
jgi:hypothetical protein